MAYYAVVDLSNLFHRARHSAMGDPETKIGLSLLIVFRSLRKLYRELKVDHIVFAVDYSSWRYEAYPAYKSRRRLDRANENVKEKEENEMFFSALSSLITYLDEHTRCTVLRAYGIEGDDFVARWIDTHPDDQHVIISGDSDFVQLLSPNVRIYDAINQRMIAIDQIINYENKKLEFMVSPKDGKIKVGKPNPDFVPEDEWWKKALFIKLIRGDVGDSVFAAFPGVRYEGKKHSIKGAWDDRHARGYDWNNLMCQTWDKLVGTKQDGERLTETVRVSDEFKINESLIDLHKQPEHVVVKMDTTIQEATTREFASNVGMRFLKFCNQYDLPSLEKEATEHVIYLNAPYSKERS